jgi:ligand-binding sensor domain-containing protein
MSTHTPLTDTIIEAALTRYAARVSSDGLLDAIMADVVRTPQAPEPVISRPRWVALPAPSLRLARAVAVVGLLLAMLAGALVVGSRVIESLRRHPAALAPTGVETLATEDQGFDFRSVVVDAEGMVWASGEGVLARLDPSSGAVRTWSFSDDAALGTTDRVVPAREGGVWLGGMGGVDQALRWFDGERFRDVVPAPPGNVRTFAEAPDGSLWAGTDEGLSRWDGTSWSTAPARRTGEGVPTLAVDRSGAVWAGSCINDSEIQWCGDVAGISRYDGRTWESFDDPLANSGAAAWIGEAPDGSVWVVNDAGVVRYDGSAWTLLVESEKRFGDRLNAAMVTWAPDGTVWVGGSNYFVPNEGRTLIARQVGDTWVEYSSADGLPSTWAANVAATSHGVYVATQDGFYRLTGDRWEPVQPGAPAGPAFVSLLAGVSHDEVWALEVLDQPEPRIEDPSQAGPAALVWHYVERAWDHDAAALRTTPFRLTLTADGTLLAATAEGVTALRDGRWTVFREGPARALALGEDGTVWVGGPDATGLDDVRAFWLDDPTRALPVIPDSPLSAVESLVVGPDGSIWAGQTTSDTSVDPGLWRYRDGRWERVLIDDLVRPEERGVSAIALAPNGDLWVAWEAAAEGGERVDGVVTRFDGSTWSTFATLDDQPASWASVAVAGGGTVWAVTGAGLARFDGTAWHLVARGPFLDALSVAPDGTVFVIGPSGPARVMDAGR